MVRKTLVKRLNGVHVARDGSAGSWRWATDEEKFAAEKEGMPAWVLNLVRYPQPTKYRDLFTDGMFTLLFFRCLAL